MDNRHLHTDNSRHMDNKQRTGNLPRPRRTASKSYRHAIKARAKVS